MRPFDGGWSPWLQFVVTGAPEAWRRAGHKLEWKPKPHISTYTTPEAEAWYRRVVGAWQAAGAIRFDDGLPFVLVVRAVMERPANHWRKDGRLSAEGLRRLYPTVKPDIDNIHKGVLDALTDVPEKKGQAGELLAWRDDKNCVGMGGSSKVYVRSPLEEPRLEVWAQVMRDAYAVAQGWVEPSEAALAHMDIED